MCIVFQKYIFFNITYKFTRRHCITAIQTEEKHKTPRENSDPGKFYLGMHWRIIRFQLRE